ncbi:Rv3212 family protein [Saccharothrix sp. NRRL B-16348]|uniref:Rv3212 family protein n=1 Tax=Saccharothrix sp. NRRL B-16348 TaxID=1415542 RepID=UPI0006AF6898|nr:PQQ-binding-like beta-propeller repeat protein [Saccharothrix sp. NRRL B-16348]
MGQPEQAESNGQVVLDEEDVLAKPVEPQVEPQDDDAERHGAGPHDTEPDEPVPSRSWRTRGDFIGLTLVVVAVLVASLVLWLTSDARNTVSQTGPSEITPLQPVTAMPPTLSEIWRAPSGATPVPVNLDSVVVTGDGGEVVGRDALTGDVRWRYARDLALCTVTTAWGRVFAVHGKDTNCSEVTTLETASGKRGPQRNGDAEFGTRLLNEGSHVLTTGGTYVEVYRRDDLVRSMEYGALRAIVNPNKQPRTGCTYHSFAVTGGKIAMIERCPALDPSDRLTILKPNPEKSDEPQVISSTVTGENGARVIAVTANRVALAVPGRIVVFDSETGSSVGSYPVDVTADDLAGDPPGRVASTFTSTANTYWFTGSKTIALSLTELNPLWTANGTLGAGTTLAGRLLLPVDTGLKVLDQITGEEVASIRVDRGDHTGPVEMATEGPVVLEQRGGTLVALR